MIDLIKKFIDFDKEHPHVYRLFEGLTFELINAGRKYSSAFLVINRLRWDFETSSKSADGYKLPNQAGTGYARMLMAKFPEHKEFFRIRESVMDDYDWNAYIRERGQ